MIAPLWDDILTSGSSQPGEDIYIFTPGSESIGFRWIGERYETQDLIGTEVVLYKDGRIQFNYGSVNTNISPTIGVSGGDGKWYQLARFDGLTDLQQAQSVLFTPNEHTFAIRLDLGWNIVSLPVIPANKEIVNVLGSVSDGLESVWGLADAAWRIYIPGAPEQSSLNEMEAGRGYWIRTNRDGLIINVSGLMDTKPVPVSTGWSLIGPSFLRSIPTETAMANIPYESIWGYEKGAWKSHYPDNPEFSDLIEMEPGKGYWVFIK
jgi:hypothetical protein